jgi:hypothetical protein
MSYLADANLICEPTKSRASETACLWLEIHSDEIVIDAVVLGEIWDGRPPHTPSPLHAQAQLDPPPSKAIS